jgi:ferredoxin
MMIFYFSATGNCLSVAKRIGGKLISIPQVINSETLEYKDDVIGMVFPVYSLRPPKMVREFLEKVKIEADYTFAIGTYGNLPGAAMQNVQRQAKRRGFRFDYAEHLLMVDNYLPMFEIGKEIESLPKKKTEEMTQRIVDDIRNRRKRRAKASYGWQIITSILKVVDNFLSNGKQAQRFIVDEKCNRCGVCSQVCPANNIIVNDKVKFAEQCEGCLACVHLCPQNAIHLTSEKSSKRWINPEVTIKEIISANNRNK